MHDPKRRNEAQNVLQLRFLAGPDLNAMIENPQKVHLHMFRSHLRKCIFYYDHRPADTPSVTRNVHSSVMVIDIYAHEFAKLVASAELSKLGYEVRWMSCKADDGSVDVDDKSVWSINLCSRCQSNI